MATLKYRKNSSSPWETLKALPQTGTVRYDLAQSLDTTQQRMARSNIGAAAASDVANAVGYEAQSGFTNLQREQACENIGAVTYLSNQILTEQEKTNARNNIGATEAKFREVVTLVTLTPATLTEFVTITLNANKINMVLVEGDSATPFEIALIEGTFEFAYSMTSSRPSCFVILPTSSEVSETALRARVHVSTLSTSMTATLRVRIVEFNN